MGASETSSFSPAAALISFTTAPKSAEPRSTFSASTEPAFAFSAAWNELGRMEITAGLDVTAALLNTFPA